VAVLDQAGVVLGGIPDHRDGEEVLTDRGQMGADLGEFHAMIDQTPGASVEVEVGSLGDRTGGCEIEGGNTSGGDRCP